MKNIVKKNDVSGTFFCFVFLTRHCDEEEGKKHGKIPMKLIK